LEKVKQLQAEELQVSEEQCEVAPHLDANGSGDGRKGQRGHRSKEILEYVCWLANPNKLYELALSFYDLELVAMIAQFTQKDPKEYVSYLNAVQAIEDPIERRCQICLDIKNFEQAVVELSRGSAEQ